MEQQREIAQTIENLKAATPAAGLGTNRSLVDPNISFGNPNFDRQQRGEENQSAEQEHEEPALKRSGQDKSVEQQRHHGEDPHMESRAAVEDENYDCSGNCLLLRHHLNLSNTFVPDQMPRPFRS